MDGTNHDMELPIHDYSSKLVVHLIITIRYTSTTYLLWLRDDKPQ
jgi:hypothetical protein